jgi:PAS domain S-box-containing protein
MKPISLTSDARCLTGAFMKAVFAAYGLLCILLPLGVPGGSMAAEGDGIKVVVLDASSGAATDGDAIWRLILEYVAEKESWSIEYRRGSLDEGLEQLKTNDIDLLTAVPHKHADKQSGLIAQEAVLSTWATVFTHMGLSVDSLIDLRDLKIGVVQGDFNNTETRGVLNGLGIALMLVEFKSGDELLKALESRWVDAAVVDRFYGDAKIREYQVVKTPIIFSPMDYRFAVSVAAGQSMLNVLDYHVRALKKDPSSVYNRYLERLSGEKSDRRLLKYFKYGLSTALICLFAVTFHALILRHRVKARTSELTQINSDLKEALAKREKAEHDQRAMENRFYSLFQASPDGIAIHDIVRDGSGTAVDYIITDINPAYTKHLAMNRGQVLGKRASQFYGTHCPSYLAVFAESALNGIPHQFETFFKPSYRHFHITGYSPDRGQFVTVFEDITDRKKAEASIKASEEKYRRLVENAHDLIIVAQDGVLRFANPAATNVFGYNNLDEVSFASIVHPEDRRLAAQLDAIESNRAIQLSYHTFRALTKNGKVRWLQMNAVQIDWNKKPAALCIIRDITDAKHLENQLAQAQKMQAIGTLAGGIAHDFNNILAAIIGYTEICRLKATQADDLHRDLDKILKAGERAKDLVKQILTFSHQSENVKKPMEIKYCIKETLKLLKATIPSNIQIRHDIQPVPAIVMADPTQIQRIVMNLCTNAAHAMQETGGILEICLRNVEFDQTSAGIHKQLEPGAYVALTVSDTGQGMTTETLQRIFEPYFTTKKLGEGTGLGLSVVHGIVRKLNGVIKVYSEIGSGSTFNIYLPRIEASPEPATRTAVERPSRGCETILLVDDEAMVLDMTREMLMNLGYDVVSESGGAEALNTFQLQPNRFDLVITDQTMPQMTGKRLAQEMMLIRPDLPIILCTGFSASINEEQALSMGIRAFIRKPILRNELAAIVRRALDRG